MGAETDQDAGRNHPDTVRGVATRRRTPSRATETWQRLAASSPGGGTVGRCAGAVVKNATAASRPARSLRLDSLSGLLPSGPGRTEVLRERFDPGKHHVRTRQTPGVPRQQVDYPPDRRKSAPIRGEHPGGLGARSEDIQLHRQSVLGDRVGPRPSARLHRAA